MLNYGIHWEFDLITQLTLNTMYRLQNDHAVIDGIGLFSTGVEEEKYLNFVQVSTQLYSTRKKYLFTNT